MQRFTGLHAPQRGVQAVGLDQFVVGAGLGHHAPFHHVDPVRAAYLARQLVDRLAPGGVLAFHFRDGQLDEDDFDSELQIDLRRWGSTAFAFLRASRTDPVPALEDRDVDMSDVP